MSIAEYSIEVQGSKELTRALERYPQVTRSTMSKYVSRAVVGVDRAVKDNTPVYQGRLRSDIHGEVRHIGEVEVQGAVLTTVDYAAHVEFGTAPHFPPRGPIERWAHLVLGDSSLWYVVARAIAARGTRARGMFAKGLLEERANIITLLRQARDEIVERLRRGGI